MNTKQFIIGSVFVGTFVALNSVALGEGDPRVRVIELPDQGVRIPAELAFSDDGSTIVLRQNDFLDRRVLVYRDHEWDLVLKLESDFMYGLPKISGISADGSVFAINNGDRSIISRDGLLTEIPDVWIDDQGQVVTDGQVYVRSVSRDGQTLGLSGSAPDSDGTDALIWDIEKGMMNLNVGFTGDEIDHQILGMNDDGFAIAGSSAYLAQTNNYRQYYGYHDAWVINAHGMITIPQPSVGEDLVMKVVDVSNDGQTVIGIGTAPWQYAAPLQQAGVTTLLPQETLSWVWTPEYGTELIAAPKQYERVIVFDVSGHGDVVLGYGYGPNDVSEQFLWTRAGGFVPLWGYLDTLGIENHLYFHADVISDNGELLMGWGYDDTDGSRHAVIIDISEDGI